MAGADGVGLVRGHVRNWRRNRLRIRNGKLLRDDPKEAGAGTGSTATKDVEPVGVVGNDSFGWFRRVAARAWNAGLSKHAVIRDAGRMDCPWSGVFCFTW